MVGLLLELQPHCAATPGVLPSAGRPGAMVTSAANRVGFSHPGGTSRSCRELYGDSLPKLSGGRLKEGDLHPRCAAARERPRMISRPRCPWMGCNSKERSSARSSAMRCGVRPVVSASFSTWSESR